MKERDSSMRNKILAYAVCAVCLSATPSIQAITAYAAEQQSNLPYSRFWETQPDGSWKYKYDNGTYATGWILDEVDGNWYYMDSSGIMQSGLYTVSYTHLHRLWRIPLLYSGLLRGF